MMDIMARGMAVTAMTEVTVLNNYVTTQLIKIDLIKIVSELPETGEENKIYLVPKNTGESSDRDFYDEYIWVNKGTEAEPSFQWEFVASRAYNVDLSNYATKDYVATEMSKNDIDRTEYIITTASESYEITGEVINVEMIDTITLETVFGSVKTKKEGDISKVTISFSTIPTNPIRIIIFST